MSIKRKKVVFSEVAIPAPKIRSWNIPIAVISSVLIFLTIIIGATYYVHIDSPRQSTTLGTHIYK